MSEKIQYLNNQTRDLENDFDVMKVAREKAKLQLEARFNEILRKIQNSKDFINSQGQRINQNLLAFQNKFDYTVQKIDEENTLEFEEINNLIESNFSATQKKIDFLQSSLDQEKQDRIQEGQSNLQNIYEQISQLNQLLIKEKMSRAEKEAEIYQILNDDYTFLSNKLTTEIDDMKGTQQQIEQNLQDSLQNQKIQSKEFEINSVKEFNFITQNCQNEINQRLNNQDNIVENLGKTIATIQNTLKEIVKR